MTNKDKAPIYHGHRERMRSRLRLSGSSHMQTYELLEMLLYHIIPRKNTHPISKLLLNEFGSLEGLFSAKREELLKVEGVGNAVADFILEVGDFINAVPDSQEERRSFENYKEAGLFFTEYFKDKKSSETVLLLLDSKLQLLNFSKIYDFDLASGALHTKPFITKAIKHNAAVAIVAHNHPFSIAYPTNADWESAKLLKGAFDDAGVILLECFIVSNDKYCGFLSHLPSEFSQILAFPSFFAKEDV